MKKLVLGFSIVTSLMLLSTAAFGQEYLSPEYNNCVREFYDPAMYNWLSYENVCGHGISVVYIPYHPGYGGSQIDLGPGRHNSTGYSRSEVQQKGGFELYICPSGYVPVDANNGYVNRVNTQFRCKKN
jgi:hypothetical protein